LRRLRPNERWKFCQLVETFVREVIIGLRALRVRERLVDCLEVVCSLLLAFSALEAIGLEGLVDALSATPPTIGDNAGLWSSPNGTNVESVGLCLE
jgi:hypothetical protein